MAAPAASQLAAAKYQAPVLSAGPADTLRGSPAAGCRVRLTRWSAPMPSSQPSSPDQPAIRHCASGNRVGQNHSVAACPAGPGSGSPSAAVK